MFFNLKNLKHIAKILCTSVDNLVTNTVKISGRSDKNSSSTASCVEKCSPRQTRLKV